MYRKASRKATRRNSRINRMRPLAGLLATGLSIPAFAQSVPFPTYSTGAQPNDRRQPDDEPCSQGSEGSLAREEEADLRRQTNQA